jgi:hypothetical protein
LIFRRDFWSFRRDLLDEGVVRKARIERNLSGAEVVVMRVEGLEVGFEDCQRGETAAR